MCIFPTYCEVACALGLVLIPAKNSTLQVLHFRYISCGEVSTGNSESLILTHARFLGLGLGFGSKPKQHHSTRTAAAPKLASYGQNINIASILGSWSTQAYNSDDV